MCSALLARAPPVSLWPTLDTDEDARTFDLLGLYATLARLCDLGTAPSVSSTSGDAARRHMSSRAPLDLYTVPHDQGPEWILDVVSPLYVPAATRQREQPDGGVPQVVQRFLPCRHWRVPAPRSGLRRGPLGRICGTCGVCTALDDFMLDPKLTQAHFVGAQPHGAPVVTASDLVSFYSIADTAVDGGTSWSSTSTRTRSATSAGTSDRVFAARRRADYGMEVQRHATCVGGDDAVCAPREGV
ncbi:hypothetical protein GGX14DRAFT_657227 [Mycena pura]|uniref:Uncharacterized protein n=1 Tax=Mycena pura TaxID=153505 RepID=A0AAD7E1Y1_9AGAR|nr:hypothetical protein GGX14DRAFT_657227 [Mycena pura]